MIKLKRGMDIPISGQPEQVISDAGSVRSVALVGFDYVGMKPTMAVQVGDRVKLGQTLFTDKKNPGVVFTSPSSGTVAAINRGAKRVLQSVVVDIDGDDAIDFGARDAAAIADMSGADVRKVMQESGLWAALRTRPFSKVPAIDAETSAIFVTAMDTHPLAADPAIVIAEQKEAFLLGQVALAQLSLEKVFVCAAPGADIPLSENTKVSGERFAGPHPAGLAGTHMHHLYPVSAARVAWSISYQDVIALGRLLTEGKLSVERVISLAGPQVEKPRLLRTRLGADLEELCAGEVKEGENRIISGSVLGGRKVRSGTSYLGRYHQQVSVLLEGRQREFMGWFSPGFNKHSNLRIYASKILPGKLLDMTTNTNGSERAMVPVGSYEDVVPMDMLPTQLLRALIVGDTETAQQLGCLELEEEDLALCSYVCPGKYEYGPILRDNLSRIDKEG